MPMPVFLPAGGGQLTHEVVNALVAWLLIRNIPLE